MPSWWSNLWNGTAGQPAPREQDSEDDLVWAEPTAGPQAAEEPQGEPSSGPDTGPGHSPQVADDPTSPEAPTQDNSAADPVRAATHPPEGNPYTMSQIEQSINELLSIDGATGAAIVDIASGMALASGGNPGFNLDVAAAGNSNVVRAKLNTMSDLGLTQAIDDILVTLDNEYHLINVLSDDANKGLFMYLVLNKRNGNLALARHKLSVVARNVRV